MDQNTLEVMFSSKKSDWETPKDFFKKIDNEFHFELDVCATSENTKCKNYFTPEQDGLNQPWKGICWCNPPYDRSEKACKPNCKKKKCIKREYHIDKDIPGCIHWVAKAFKEMVAGNATTLMLLPARTDTEYFHTYIWDNQRMTTKHGSNWMVSIKFVQGRLTFEGTKNPAPFPSMLVLFEVAKDE